MFEDRDFREIAALPLLDETTLAIIWPHERYDGPLNGMVSEDDHSYWFEYHCHDPESYRWYRLYRLSDIDREFLRLWRIGEGIFQTDISELTRGPDYRETETFKKFMSKWTPFLDAFPDFAARKPDARCRSGQNQSFYAIQVYWKPEESK